MIVIQDNLVGQNYISCKVLVDVISNSFGPNGRDKLIIDVNGNMHVSNDAGTILRSIRQDHAAPRIMTMVCLDNKYDVGDGKKSIVLLANEILKNSCVLSQKGYHLSVIRHTVGRILDFCLGSIKDFVTVSEITEKSLRNILISVSKGKHEGIIDCLVNIFLWIRVHVKMSKFHWKFIKIMTDSSSKMQVKLSTYGVRVGPNAPVIGPDSPKRILITCNLTNRFLGDDLSRM
jgi:chaperonin GroEL (HSP60 family)